MLDPANVPAIAEAEHRMAELTKEARDFKHADQRHRNRNRNKIPRRCPVPTTRGNGVQTFQ